jgi:hypothetical protein
MTEELYEIVGEDAAPAKGRTASSQKSTTSGVSQPTVLDRLKETIGKKIERKNVFIEIPERPGVMIEVSPNITQHKLKAWRKQCGEDSKNGIDALKFACTIVAQTTCGIYINDEQAVDEDGYPFTLASDEILSMVGTDRVIPDGVRLFFGVDPHVESAALAILDAAGYGDTVEAVDPTKRS